MASENKKTPGPAAPPAGPPPTVQEYRKEQMRLREMIEKQKQLSGRLAHLEETINQKETAYLDSTPAGNIITGYEGYIKGSAAAANKKKAVPTEQNRVFTRSSISYRPNAAGEQTPGSATPAQTPGSGTASGNATPTSATVSRSGIKKKKVDDESEPDSAPGNTKKRTAFGAVRK